ncbi:PIG-L family deacetylase [Croceibacterium sp. TMG7-5b_MA50]|uniref:PIG-L deacetylase family protein n=1 Tax=Croceibacterium sp. TMG7-5b_MA50 TaxID=3121290 RepID=UPI003221A2F1
MSHVVAVSPHLDDAAFSIGGFLAARARGGDQVTIVTCFTGNVAEPAGFALACQLDKGLPSDVDYMALRRAEDLAACAVIGAEAIHLPLLEAPHRGYANALELFGTRHPDDNALAPLTRQLAEQVTRLQPDLLLGPMAIGDHVDHWLVRDALARTGQVVELWEDWPYLTRAIHQPAVQAARVHVLTAEDRAARLAMCRAFATQIGFQFGGGAGLERASSSVTEERLFTL